MGEYLQHVEQTNNLMMEKEKEWPPAKSENDDQDKCWQEQQMVWFGVRPLTRITFWSLWKDTIVVGWQFAF